MRAEAIVLISAAVIVGGAHVVARVRAVKDAKRELAAKRERGMDWWHEPTLAEIQERASRAPEVIRQAFECFDDTNEEITHRYAADVGKLYPIVPFVAEDVPTGIIIFVGLIGALAERVPPLCEDVEALANRLDPAGAELVGNIARDIRSSFSLCGFTLERVGFDSMQRVSVDEQHYFR